MALRHANPVQTSHTPELPLGTMWIEVDLSALRYNLSVVKDACPPRTKIIAVAKADGYGHGAVQVSRTLLEAGAWGVAVARLREGIELRRSGIDVPVIVLGYESPEELELAVENDLTVEISSEETMATLVTIAGRRGIRARAHLKVDTGMHRYGVKPDEAIELLGASRNLPQIDIEGLYTHFATADEPASPAFAAQLREFRNLLDTLDSRQLRPRIVHAANSAAALSTPESCFDAVRVGIALYGVSPSPECSYSLRPAMSVKALVGRILDVPAGGGVSYGHTYIASQSHKAAVITCGYADGYPRSLSNLGEILVGGRRRKVIGRVCMDSVIVELGKNLDVAVGDEAVILGTQGSEQISAQTLANLAGTIPYEILCGIGRRSERVYIG